MCGLNILSCQEDINDKHFTLEEDLHFIKEKQKLVPGECLENEMAIGWNQGYLKAVLKWGDNVDLVPNESVLMETAGFPSTSGALIRLLSF